MMVLRSNLQVIGLIASYLLMATTITNTQSILDRLRPVNGTAADGIKGTNVEEFVKVVSGTKVKRFERLTVPLGGTILQPIPYGFGYNVPLWQAGAKIVGNEQNANIQGMITFQQLPYSSDIKVTLNVTGLPVGKHALHIHTYGDISDGCKSTGGQFPNNFIGNVDTKENGSISTVFISVYLNLFGFNGIVGRSIVIHSKPIDLNTALNAEVFSSSIQAVPDAIAYQNEENSVGASIACGVISIMSTQMMNKPTTMPTTMPMPMAMTMPDDEERKRY